MTTTTANGASAPTVFNFQSIDVRAFADDSGEPWFCAADVCAVLGYVNSRQAIQKNCRSGGVSIRDTPTTSGVQAMTFINEGNLYRLIVKSRKPEAQAFEQQVMEVILPAIRKTGRYETPVAPTLPPPVSALDRQTRSRINRRALELSHRAYETYRDQMLTCHLIKSNRVAIEEWLPPQLAEDVIRDARLAANFLGIYSKSIHDTASAIARLAGLETPTEG